MLKFKLECYKNIRNNTILKPWSDDLTLGWLIRTICRFVSRTCRMIWPYAGWSRLVQKPVSGQIGLTGLRSGPEQCNGAVVMRKMPSKDHIQMSSHHWHKFGYIHSDSKQLKHNFNYWILFVCIDQICE